MIDTPRSDTTSSKPALYTTLVWLMLLHALYSLFVLAPLFPLFWRLIGSSIGLLGVTVTVLAVVQVGTALGLLRLRRRALHLLAVLTGLHLLLAAREFLTAPSVDLLPFLSPLVGILMLLYYRRVFKSLGY